MAFDGKGNHSPFAAALLKYLGTPGDAIVLPGHKVMEDVYKTTKGQEMPWSNSSLREPLVLVK